MWIPRVKIHITSSVDNRFYKIDEWIKFNKFKDKDLYYRFTKTNDIEFIIYAYESREEALKDGKILYFNILFYGYKTFQNYSMGDFDYIKWYCHPKCFNCSQEDFYKNEEWFYCKKSGLRDFYGLQVECVESIEKIDEYKEKNKLTGIISAVLNEELDFISKMSDIDYNCSFNSENLKIFNLFHLVEKSDDEIQILLLCQILETMGINDYKSEKAISILDDFKEMIKTSDIIKEEKSSLLGGLENLKNESSNHKIKELIKKYNKVEYKKINKNKIIDDCYKLRSKIIHGEKLNEEDDVGIVYYLKFIVLDTFKEWSKDNNN